VKQREEIATRQKETICSKSDSRTVQGVGVGKWNLKDKTAQALELRVKAVTGKVGELTEKER
jgi:hypothetical protein